MTRLAASSRLRCSRRNAARSPSSFCLPKHVYFVLFQQTLFVLTSIWCIKLLQLGRASKIFCTKHQSSLHSVGSELISWNLTRVCHVSAVRRGARAERVSFLFLVCSSCCNFSECWRHFQNSTSLINGFLWKVRFQRFEVPLCFRFSHVGVSSLSTKSNVEAAFDSTNIYFWRGPRPLSGGEFSRKRAFGVWFTGGWKY